MAPTKPIRTYSRGSNKSISCMEALDILFVKNKTEKKLAKRHKGVKKAKKKIQIKELPQKIKSYVVDDSMNESSLPLHINLNDTFDRLFKDTHVCKVVKAKEQKLPDSSIKTVETKNHGIQRVAYIHSPTFKKTRLRLNTNNITEIKNESNDKNQTNSWFKQKTLDPIDSSLEIEVMKNEKYKKHINCNSNSRDSPILLRSMDNKKCNQYQITENLFNSSLVIYDKKENPNCLSKQEDTLNIKNEKLPEIRLNNNKNKTVETIKKNRRRKIDGCFRSPILLRSRVSDNFSSSIKSAKEENIPKLLKTEASDMTKSDIKSKYHNESHNQTASFFTHSLQERILVHSSTPLVANTKTHIIKQALSPININETTIDHANDLSPSRSKIVQKAIVQSLEEVNNWNNTFPKINDKLEDPYQLNIDNFAGSNLQEQLFNMETFLRQKRQSLSNIDRARKRKTKKLSFSKSYNLEEFEKFYSSMTPDSSDSSKSFSLTDFEAFHQEFSDKISYVTKRKDKNSFENHLKSLHKKFDLKSLHIQLNDIVNNKSKSSRKTTRSFFPTNALLKSFTSRQPVISLTRLSLNNLNSLTEKSCLEKTQSNNNSVKSKPFESSRQKMSKRNICHQGKSLPSQKLIDKNILRFSTGVIDLTSESIENSIDLTTEVIDIQKENSVGMPNKQARSKRIVFPRLSTPLRARNGNKRTSRIANSDESTWTIDLTLDENPSRNIKAKVSSNTDDSYCIDLTDDDNIVVPSIEHKNRKSKNKNDTDNQRRLSSKNNQLILVEDAEKTKLDLEELFGIVHTNESTCQVSGIVEDGFLDKSPVEFNGFNFTIEPVSIRHSTDSINESRKKTHFNNTLSYKIKNVGNQNSSIIKNKNKITNNSKSKNDESKSPNNSKSENNRLSLQDILNNMLETTETRKEKPSHLNSKKYSLRSKYETQTKRKSMEFKNFEDTSETEDLSDHSIFFKSLQLLPTQKDTSGVSNDQKNTLPNVCDLKNFVVNSNVSLPEFMPIIECNDENTKDNEIVEVIEDDDDFQDRNLVVELTLRDLESEHFDVDHKRTGQNQENLDKKKIVVDLTANDFQLESEKVFSNFNTSNIFKTDPMEDELEISYCIPNNSIRLRDRDFRCKANNKEMAVFTNKSFFLEPSEDCFKLPNTFDDVSKKKLTLKAGKSWRRSLLTQRKENSLDLTKESLSDLGTSLLQTSILPNFAERRQSVRIVPVQSNVTSRKTSILQNYAIHSVLNESKQNNSSIYSPLRQSIAAISARDIVLKRCGQTEPLPFSKLYPSNLLKECRKIGEGVYGEVFLYKRPNGQLTVMKVIPIEGNLEINGERQKKFHEILSEIVISSELSNLRSQNSTRTAAFCEVQRICCVKGCYPDKLLDLWDQYDQEKQSENESPEVFTKDQLYIVLDLANAGQDLEAFVFNNASQACAMFQQVACALACAEEHLKFEHRDLHWGNVLLRQVDKNQRVTCTLSNMDIVTQTKGVEATIIDFTLSRMTTDGVVMFNDLSNDPDLFLGDGDYQFDIYRKMKDKNENDWEKFEPYSNILWLHYILDKSIKELRYKSTKTKIHSTYINELKKIQDLILGYKSAQDFVNNYYC